MKSVLFILLAISVLSIQAQTNTGWQQEKLKGKVKSLKTEWNYRYMPDGKNFTPWSAEDGSVITFSSAGQELSVQYFKKGTILSSTSKYIYKPATHEYEIKGYWPDGRVISSSLYKTDLRGNILEESQLDSAGKIRKLYKYAYDSKGTRLNYAGYTPAGVLTSKTTYTVNAAGKMTKVKAETPGYATSYTFYEYDAKGNISVETEPGGGGLHSFRNELFYDDKNNLIRELKYMDDEKTPRVSTWKYEYDSHGNWTKQTEYSEEGEPFSVYTRTILYY